MDNSQRGQAIRHKLEDRYERLERSRKVGPLVATGKRFFEIDGLTLSTLLAIELFTTVIPLIILGFSYVSDFAQDASVGNLIIRQLGLDGESAEQVRVAFGSSASLRSSWTFLGVAGFLVWGIPMSITVAAMFARAWRREQFTFGSKLWRGAVWFVVYLTMISTRNRLSFDGDVGPIVRGLLVVVALSPIWLFWTLSPALLVRDGARGWKALMYAGLAGVLIDGVGLGIAVHVFFPILLEGWTAFGPMGVAMTLMTWCGVIGVGWVLTACAGAIIWERLAPSATVIEAQSAVPEVDETVVEGETA